MISASEAAIEVVAADGVAGWDFALTMFID
jgi:hypothetical protein